MKVIFFERKLYYLGKSYTISPPPSPALSRAFSAPIFFSPFISTVADPPPTKPTYGTRYPTATVDDTEETLLGTKNLAGVGEGRNPRHPLRDNDVCGGDGEKRNDAKEEGGRGEQSLGVQHRRAFLRLHHVLRHPRVGAVGHMPSSSPASFSAPRSASSSSPTMALETVGFHKWIWSVADLP